MKLSLSLLPSALLLMIACGFFLPVAPAGAQTVVAPVVIYETPPVFKASDLLDPALLVGPHHKVRADVTTDGFTNTYIIDSDFGAFYAHGNDLVPERVREIYAIAGIRKTKESKAYRDALGNAAKGTVDGAVNLVKDPVSSIKGIGKGTARFFKGASERVKTMSDDSGTAESYKDYGSSRRKIAGQYGVDPYSSNQVLQAEIDSLATATGAGKLTLSLITLAIPGGAGIAASGLSTSSNLNQLLVDEGPYNLRAENRERLKSMAISEPLIEAFLNHPVLNPKHQTVITLALTQLGSARAKGEYLRLAMASRSPEDAYFFQRNAELMLFYHRNRSPVVEIVDFFGLAAVHTQDNKLVLPVLLDYGSWTATGDQLSRSFAEFTRSDLTIEGREWFLSGAVSPKAKAELEARGILVTGNAFAAGSAR